MRRTVLSTCALALAINYAAAGNSDPSQAPAICAAQGSDSILVAHEDCSKFYKCYKGLPVAIDCPLNLLYNPDKEYCDWPENVNCAQNDAPGNDNSDVSDNLSPHVNKDPSEAENICAAQGSDGTLVTHAECNKFYECSGGLPVAFECPENLMFSAEKKYCDWPQNVVCA